MRNNRRRNKKQNKTNPNIKKVIIPLLLALVILFISTIFAITNSVSEKIISRTKINQINVSNLTINEAYNKLTEELKQRKTKNIVIKTNDYETTVSLEQLEVNYDITEAINEAIKIGREKNIIKNNYQIMFNKIFGKNINKEIKINEEELENIVEDISVKIPGIVVESSYYIENDKLIILKGKQGIQVDKEQLKEKIINAIKKQIYNNKNETIEIPITQKTPEDINIENIHEEIYKQAQNAYYEENPFKLHAEVEGIDFNIEEAKKQLQEEKDEYTIQLNITQPEIKISNLKYENFFPEQLSKFTTRYDESNLNRSNNIKLSSEKIDQKILMPGETFSYNKTVGERTIKAGYKEAAVYMGGKVVDGIGGGICQVSSTLYNAALQANLEIVSRKNHYFITSYVSASRDATVSYGTIDFKFKNNRTYPIKIECTSKNGICQVSIYGIKEETEYEVVIKDQITEVMPYETKYIKTDELETGKELEVQKGVNGYKSEAYRILKLNGAVISKTLLSKDSYNPLDRIVKIGK